MADRPLDPEVIKKLVDYLNYEKSQNGWRDRLSAKVDTAVDHSKAARNAAESAVNEVLGVRKELQDHMVDEAEHRTIVLAALAKYDEWKRHIDSDIDELQDKEEVTGVQDREKLLGKLKEARESHATLKKALWGIAATILVTLVTSGAAYAIKGIIATNTASQQVK